MTTQPSWEPALRYLRQDCALEFRQIAGLIGTSAKTIQRWMAGLEGRANSTRPLPLHARALVAAAAARQQSERRTEAQL